MKKRITLLLVLTLCSFWAWSNPKNDLFDPGISNVTDVKESLTNENADDTSLDTGLVSVEDDEKSARIKKQLTGEWGNNSTPISVLSPDTDEIETSAYLSYKFNKDGTYIKTLRGGTFNKHEGGLWDISKDGKYLILHFKSNLQDYPCETSRLIRIKYLELDELVLEHNMESNSLESASGSTQNYYFNKR